MELLHAEVKSLKSYELMARTASSKKLNTIIPGFCAGLKNTVLKASFTSSLDEVFDLLVYFEYLA